MIIEHFDWKSQIISHLKNESPTSTEAEFAKLKMKVARYILIDDILYKKSFSLPYLRCLGQDEAEYALREIHKGNCDQHLGGQSMAHKTLRQGFY